MSVAILVPVLRRPQRVASLLRSIGEATPQPHRVLFIADPDDATELAAIAKCGADCIAPGGSYAHKINCGAQTTTEPLIFVAADDLGFKPGWLEAAEAMLTEGIGVVGTNDLGSPRVMAGEHATHSLVTREYAAQGTIDDSSKLLHEGYHHNFVDDELVATAKHRGAFAFAADSHVEHFHPFWDKGEMDEIYQLGQAQFRFDRRHFLRRQHLWT